MSRIYRPAHRALQEQFDTVRLADRLEAVKWHEHLDERDRSFIESRDMFFLATADDEGRPTCSYKGGDPGFVRAVDERTLIFPSWDGNGMYLSAGNTRMNPHVGLLFIDFQSPRRLRVHGEATLLAPDAGPVAWPGAQFLVRVAVREVFPNCPRYIHRTEVVEASPFVPREGVEPPVPAWKRSDWARDVLPAGDPARQEPEPEPR
jgi:predicted pyridoxine 5'-phosphate oxidase superfamily flavin-nucleotide-binding protein